MDLYSHVNIMGDTGTDCLAKQSFNMFIINSTNYLELQEVFAIIKSHIINQQQRNYDGDPKVHHNYICPVA